MLKASCWCALAGAASVVQAFGAGRPFPSFSVTGGLFNMFPRTARFETLVVLKRR